MPNNANGGRTPSHGVESFAVKATSLPPRRRGADQKWKEAKLVTFYDPDNDRRYTAATTGNHHALGRLM